MSQDSSVPLSVAIFRVVCNNVLCMYCVSNMRVEFPSNIARNCKITIHQCHIYKLNLTTCCRYYGVRIIKKSKTFGREKICP